MCVAMAALEATIHVQGARGTRAIPFGEFHLLPGDTPHRETVLEPGDLITHVTLPPPAWREPQQAALSEAARSSVVRVRPGVGRGRVDDRRRQDRRGRALRWAAWARSPGDRPRPKRRWSVSPPDEANFRKAAEAALRDAKPQSENGFKIELAKRCLTHALQHGRDGLRRTERMANTHVDAPTRPADSPIGSDTPRVDGPLKVTGGAQYTSDFHFPGMLYAVPVEATIANGRIAQDRHGAPPRECPACERSFIARTSARSSAPVPGRASRASATSGGRRSRTMSIRYYGQYVALAVADTFEAAKAAADAVRVTYAAEKPNVDDRSHGG